MIHENPSTLALLKTKRLRTRCPHCGVSTTLTLVSEPNLSKVRERELKKVIAGYICDECNEPIPIIWLAGNCHHNSVDVRDPEMVFRVVKEFDFSHVPEAVTVEIKEALDCLSVNAYNGFACSCRRTIQAVCTTLGTGGTSKVENQLKELKRLADLDTLTYDTAHQIMLSGHDGAHPHLPTVDKERAELLFELLQDLIFQLFTRLGRIERAKDTRKQKIKSDKKTNK